MFKNFISIYKTIILPLVILIVLLFPSRVLAQEIFFQDNFNEGNANKWEVVGGFGWKVVNGEYGVEEDHSLTNTVPSDVNWDPNWTNIKYEVDLRGETGTDKNILIKFKDTSNFIEIHHTFGDIYLTKVIDGIGQTHLDIVHYPLLNGSTYEFSIDIKNNKDIKVYINDELVLEGAEPEPLMQDWKIGLRVGRSADVWYDNVKITSLDDSPQNPIILLPGYGGSYNFDALVHDSDVPDSDWKLTPFFDEKVYGGIIKTLENTNYERNENFYVYPYDWRRNAGDTANNLSDFIDTQVLTGDYENSQVNLIGHSFGGLIGRAYAQNNTDKVENLITVGSPHKGALKTYNIWEGADFSDMPFYQEIPLRGFIRTKMKDYDTKVEALQNFSPSLLNIWPTFDFLKNTDGSIKPLSSLTWHNNFLPELDGSLPDILDLLSTISGNIPSSTKRFIVVEEPSETNIRFGKWVDGRPVSVENDAGDETVLLSSSQIDSSSNHELNNLSHTEIIYKEEGLGKILEILGVEGEIETSIFENFNKAIMAFIASPATFKVIGPGGQEFMPSDNLLIINNPQDGEYEAVVTGQEDGEYTLYFGRIKGGDEAWDIVKNHILEGNEATHQFEVNFDDADLGSEPIEKLEDLIEHLKTIITESDAGKLPEHLMIKEVEKLERIINLYNKFDKQRTADNMLKLLNLQINFIKDGINGWPWSTLTESEKDEIQEDLNKILWLIEEDYSNRFE